MQMGRWRCSGRTTVNAVSLCDCDHTFLREFAFDRSRGRRPSGVGAGACTKKKKNQMPFITGQKLKALSERRVVERRRVNIGSWVTSLDGAMVLAWQTRDASASGVRVQPKE